MKIVISTSAQKQRDWLKEKHIMIYLAFKGKLDELANTPMREWKNVVKTFDSHFMIRQSKYRLLFDVEIQDDKIIVIWIGHVEEK